MLPNRRAVLVLAAAPQPVGQPVAMGFPRLSPCERVMTKARPVAAMAILALFATASC